MPNCERHWVRWSQGSSAAGPCRCRLYLFEASWKAREFVVEVLAESKTYRVNTDKLLDWLSKDRDGSPRKEYLRRVLDGLAE